MDTYQLALIAVRVLMAHSPSVARDGTGHSFFEPCYRRIFCPIHYSLLKVVPSSSAHFEAPTFGFRTLPSLTLFRRCFFRQKTGLPTHGTLDHLDQIHGWIHGTGHGIFCQHDGLHFLWENNTSLMDPMGIKSVRSRIVFSFLFF